MLKVIAFDADDTLWHNEAYFQETEHKFCALLENYLPQHTVARELLQTEIANISLYGYGIKAFMLSMIETAIRITDKQISNDAIEKIISYGRSLQSKHDAEATLELVMAYRLRQIGGKTCAPRSFRI